MANALRQAASELAFLEQCFDWFEDLLQAMVGIGTLPCMGLALILAWPSQWSMTSNHVVPVVCCR
jgi:hypothetical protein